MAPLFIMHRLLGSMLARRQGGVLHIGSGAGQLFLSGSATPVGTHRCLDGFLESLRLEVEGTGVIITQVISGPLKEREAQGAEGAQPFFQISVEQCAREALAAFERRQPLVYPGLGHHWVMTLLPLLPRMLRRVLGRLAARSLQPAPVAVSPLMNVASAPG